MPKPCNRCGKCCLHMRRYLVIERSIGDSQHYCTFRLTSQRFLASIGGEDLMFFRDKNGMNAYPDACPFLRLDASGSFICTIYPSRPDHCRSFTCA